jgi:hypothetical protein
VFVAAPLLAQGSDADRCGADLPLADATSLGCSTSGAMDDVVQGDTAAELVENGSLDVDPIADWSDEDVVEVLRDDEAAWLDPDGGLFVADPIDHLAHPSAAPTPLTTAQVASDRAALPDLGDALSLHSRPGAPRTILIDVDGHVTSGSAWNTIAGGTIVSAPFDMDDDPSRFSSMERTVIRSVWQRVSEDYAPFDVDVTTEDPGLAALTRSSDSDETFGVRMVVTSTNWYGSGVGGLAYVGSFDDGLPGFVFSTALGNVDRYVAEAVTHEAGHTLGLRHDGTSTSGYYSGHNGWAPIMGVGYDAGVVQWSKGEYAGANNTEDDLAIIASYIPVVTDDHGDTALSATTVEFGQTVNGVIATPSDVDAFLVDVGAGTATFDAIGAPVAPNLDIRMQLLDSSGRPVVTSSPTSRLGATITRDLAAGRYVLLIDGVGKGDPSTGYSDYGSLGRYSVRTGLEIPVTNPTARFTASRSNVVTGQRVVFDGRRSTDADGGSITAYRWNIGPASSRTRTGSVTTHTWTSPGKYTVRLTVIGDDGKRSTATRTITVRRPLTALVRDVSLRSTADNGARLSLAVRDSRGRPVASARVSIAWGGSASGTSATITNSRGRATVTTVTPGGTGSVSAVVRRVRPPVGYVWDGRTVTATRYL